MNRARGRIQRGIFCEFLEGRQLLTGLSQDVQQLVKDLQTIHGGSSVTTTEVKAVATDFQSIAAVATKPSAGTVDALETEIEVVVASRSITPSEAVALQKDVTAVLSSAGIPQSLAQQTASDLKAIVVSSGVTKSDVKLIGSDLKAIVTDLSSLKR